MTLLALRLSAASLVIAATVLTATGCATTPQTSPTAEPAPTATSDAPEPEATPEPTVGPEVAPACDTFIAPETVAAFESVGWTSQEDAFWIGSQEITDGIFCRWGDFSTASDHMQMFGWAPVSDAEAESMQEELVAGGWIKEEATQGVYITESPDTAFATDEDGYGLTYLFADGQVTFADTKQGLLLVEWPRG